MRVVQAPKRILHAQATIFLAGSIEQGLAEDWQVEFIINATKYLWNEDKSSTPD